jgi:hypothetical protein
MKTAQEALRSRTEKQIRESAFMLGCISQRSEAETEHTGYVIVKSSANPNIGDTIPAR